jgi:hypothetical protein
VFHHRGLAIPLRQPGAQQEDEKLIASSERAAKGFRLEAVGNLLLRSLELRPVNPTFRASDSAR